MYVSRTGHGARVPRGWPAADAVHRPEEAFTALQSASLRQSDPSAPPHVRREALADRLRDEHARDRQPVVVQHGDEARGVDVAFVHEQRAHLRVPILLHDEHRRVARDELVHLAAEGEGADAQRVELDPVVTKRLERFLHGGAGGPEVDDADQGAACGRRALRFRHQPRRGPELAREPLHAAKVHLAVLGVPGILVVRRTPHQVRAALRMRRGNRAPPDPVAVHVEVSSPVPDLLEPVRVERLAAVVAARVVPLERVGGPVVHAEVEVAHHDDRSLQALREIEGGRRELERLGRVLRGRAGHAWCRRATRMRRR